MLSAVAVFTGLVSGLSRLPFLNFVFPYIPLFLFPFQKAGRCDRLYCVGDNVRVVSPHRSSLSVEFV